MFGKLHKSTGKMRLEVARLINSVSLLPATPCFQTLAASRFASRLPRSWSVSPAESPIAIKEWSHILRCLILLRPACHGECQLKLNIEVFVSTFLFLSLLMLMLHNGASGALLRDASLAHCLGLELSIRHRLEQCKILP